MSALPAGTGLPALAVDGEIYSGLPAIHQAIEEARPGVLRPVVFLEEGQQCPNCGFAALRTNEDGVLLCPVCGYGTRRPCT